MYEQSRALHMKVSEKVQFRARLVSEKGDEYGGEEVNVWLPLRDVERLYRNARRPFLKSLLLSLANRL